MTETNNPSSSNISENPTVEPPHEIQLESVKDSKIIKVSLYSRRAEVTRLFTLNVKAGQNQLQVHGLPALDQDSLRVEGRGSATIHDVTLGFVSPPHPQMTSEVFWELDQSKKQIEKALYRTKRSIAALETYLSSVNAQNVDVTKLADVVKNYDDAAAKLDNKILELENQHKVIESKIVAEHNKIGDKVWYHRPKLCTKASIGVFADHEEEIEIVLIYAVLNAGWIAGYDVRVDMQMKEKPVRLVYKGSINQSTGEDWNNVPLTLETANPTFGLSVPKLDQWTLSVYKPPVLVDHSVSHLSVSSGLDNLGGQARMLALEDGRKRSREVEHRGTDISSSGTVSATFSVPGYITIPSDEKEHNVTITELSLNATMSWLCIPKKDAKTHIKAIIKNESEYTLLSGRASVYVDGSFISKTALPLVSPAESFDCPLGVDPSIRVTYHPCSKKVSQSGFYNKFTNYTFEQRITIQNTKTHAIDRYKVLDQFPVSEDSNITVRHINPPLVLPSTDSDVSGGIGSGVSSNSLSVNISHGVLVQWDGAEEAGRGDIPIDSVGKEGKVAWICSIPASSKLGLVLHWEVTAPVKTDIAGL